MVRAFWFWSYKSLNTPVWIHGLLWNHAVLLIIRVPVDVVLWKPLCFLAYGFLTLFLFCTWFRFIFSVRMSSCWFVKQLLNCFIHYFLEFSYEFQSVSSLNGFWQVFLIFWLFLITFVILRWLVCHLLLLYFSSMFTWLSCNFVSLCWQVSWDLLPCAWWNFFHPPFFCYSSCNFLATLCVWCLPSKFPYWCHITSLCGSLLFHILLLTAISRVFVCCSTLGHISLYDTIDWFFSNAITVFQNTSKISYWSCVDTLSKPVSMSTAQLPIWYLGNTVLNCIL